MKLPDVEKAEVPEAKVVRYLLSITHRAGKSKASFFMEFGFDPDRWEKLAAALKQHAINRCKSTCYSVVVGVVSTYAKESNKDEAG